MERLLAEVDGNPGSLVYLKATTDGKLIVDGPAGGGSSAGLTDAQLRAAAVVIQSQWEDGAYTLDDDGNLISETQVNASTGATRTRAWTYTTVSGNTVATPGAWA